MKRWLGLTAVVGFLGMSSPSLYGVTNLEIDGCWVRQTPPGAKVTAAYCQITNKTKVSRTLKTVKTAAAGKVELHETKLQGDRMQMKPVLEMPIAAGETLQMAPGGLHIMLFELTGELGKAAQFTLVFDRGEERTVTFPVRKEAPERQISGHQTAPKG